MRSRSNSGIRLDYYHRVICQTILKYQNPITGLIALSDDNSHAWVRDNVYSILCVWALSLAYRKNADVDEDRAKAYELEQTVVKLMRGLLTCMMRQVNKLEKFKHTQAPIDALHAKYSSTNFGTVVSDTGWGHLQIDATSLYLLMLAQMNASGLQIIFTLDEVAFVQNLIFYVESAYRIPDYGIWERGDKTNHGLPELNASSIGMAKAAMEAMTDLDLFGSHGGPYSTIHVQADKVAQCNAILQSMLPRESNSKEVDSALLSVIGYPAFAVDDPQLVDLTHESILSKCLGRYGCCRFLRDGFKTALEDPHRLHYEPMELQKFENIECEWPVFLAYLSINCIFEGKIEQAQDYQLKLQQLLVPAPLGVKAVPEMYAVPADKVKAEALNPGSQERVPVGQIPHKWAQSLYMVSQLLIDGFISPGELDPLNRRFTVLPKPDLVVQMVILAEDDIIKDCLEQSDLHVETIEVIQDKRNFVLHPARILSETLSHLGECERLGMSGRYSGVGNLATSILYRYHNKICAFTPELYDHTTFYLAVDQDFLFDQIRTDLAYLKANWQMLGRPTMILPIYHWMSDFTGELPFEFKRLILKLEAGYLNGVRVQVGNIDSFLSTSCISSFDWLHGITDDEVLHKLENPSRESYRQRLLSGTSDGNRPSLAKALPNVHGIIKRSLSIGVDEAVIKAAPTFTLGDDTADEGAAATKRKKKQFKGGLGVPALGKSHLKVCSSICLPTSLPGSTADFTHFSNQECQDLVNMLLKTEDSAEQADIIHYLYITKGPAWETGISVTEPCVVNDLLMELYQKAGALKLWWLIRYTAGMLRKRVASLASALSDLLVRQKQVSFGVPSHKEVTVTQPLSPEDIASAIESVCCENSFRKEQPYKVISAHCMLHQEILIYLAMFVRTEPKLFHEMLRIRIGLIIQVMTSELARCLHCAAQEANLHLLNLSPYEVKNLLYHILSGKEFKIQEVEVIDRANQLSIKSEEDEQSKAKKSIRHRVSSGNIEHLKISSEEFESAEKETTEDSNSVGQWARRRRIDGALNRVPVGFYSKIWHVLTQCYGISIEGSVLSQNLIKEMTKGELKFALQVESVLNAIPEPEYRQLIVEALTTLTVFSELNHQNQFINMVIPVKSIVDKAYSLFCSDQNIKEDKHSHCAMLRGICEAFYDTAPSGRCGTITYMCRALPLVVPLPKTANDAVECCVM